HEEPTIIAEPSQRSRTRPIVGCGTRRLYRRCEDEQSSDHGLEHVVTPSPTGSVQPPTGGGLRAIPTITAERSPPGTFSTRGSSRTRILKTQVRIANGIRAVVGLDLTFPIRGVA